MLDLCIDGFKIMHGTGFATMDPNDAETPGGGGIYLHNCSGVAVVNNEITENTGANGGGLLSAGTCPGTFILADNKIWKNKTWSTNCDATEGYGGGGGVMTVDRRAMIRDNSVSDNATPSSHKECMGYRLATPSWRWHTAGRRNLFRGRQRHKRESRRIGEPGDRPYVVWPCNRGWRDLHPKR